MNCRNESGPFFLSFLIVVTIPVAAAAGIVSNQNQDALMISLTGH